jgi:hypothetical protein
LGFIDVATCIRERTFHIEILSDFKFSSIVDFVGLFIECGTLLGVDVLSKPVNKFVEMKSCVENVKNNIDVVKKEAMKLIIEREKTLLKK